ncbi:hypothetical protein PR202_ga13900 [Eleusine coracana subsp. coracana]|uniref:Protein phosphatase n=1 Tax=Eleusine coracana subsp. coracana TaxID=191504 RepID=A0AAV5CFX5_ELECO|nr:hypothetical protein PR202_ga13900 [Eleusine coracana subsp. coracana]
MLSGYSGSCHLSSHKDLVGRGGRSFLFGNTWFLLSTYSTRLLHTTDRRAPTALFAAINRAPCVRSHCTGQGLLQRGGIVMAACGYAFRRAELGVAKRQPDKDPSIGTRISRVAAMGSVASAARPDVSFRYKGVECCKKVGASLKCCEPWGNRAFWTNAAGPGWKLRYAVQPWGRDFSRLCVAPYSAGATEQQLSLDEKMDNSTVSSDGSGVDAGLYAKELMSKSMTAVKDEPDGTVDPSRVLEKAYTSTKARGSSTACIITLKDQSIHAVNLGDSGFVVVRDGRTVLRSPTQQHDFNFTYQLESGGGSDLPSSAQVFHFEVAPGDVIVAGTDGLFDNLYNNEISGVVVEALRVGLSPQAAAQKIAALARQRAMDKNRQSPFASAAQEAGYRYYGGKLDDITVVVSYVKNASSA